MSAATWASLPRGWRIRPEVGAPPLAGSRLRLEQREGVGGDHRFLPIGQVPAVQVERKHVRRRAFAGPLLEGQVAGCDLIAGHLRGCVVGGGRLRVPDDVGGEIVRPRQLGCPLAGVGSTRPCSPQSPLVLPGRDARPAVNDVRHQGPVGPRGRDRHRPAPTRLSRRVEIHPGPNCLTAQFVHIIPSKALRFAIDRRWDQRPPTGANVPLQLSPQA